MRVFNREEKLAEIAAWFERHRHDYDDCEASPPKVWSEYFAYLLALVMPPENPHDD